MSWIPRRIFADLDFGRVYGPNYWEETPMSIQEKADLLFARYGNVDGDGCWQTVMWHYCKQEMPTEHKRYVEEACPQHIFIAMTHAYLQ